MQKQLQKVFIFQFIFCLKITVQLGQSIFPVYLKFFSKTKSRHFSFLQNKPFHTKTLHINTFWWKKFWSAHPKYMSCTTSLQQKRNLFKPWTQDISRTCDPCNHSKIMQWLLSFWNKLKDPLKRKFGLSLVARSVHEFITRYYEKNAWEHQVL